MDIPRVYNAGLWFTLVFVVPAHGSPMIRELTQWDVTNLPWVSYMCLVLGDP